MAWAQTAPILEVGETLTRDDLIGVRIAMVIAAFAAVAGLGIWWVFLGRKRVIQDLPTSTAKGVSLGLNEVIGTVECSDPHVSPQAGVECAWWRNTFYVQENDDKGWRKTGEKVGGPVWFDLVDETGRVLVRPRKAEVHGVEAYEGPYDVFSLASDPNPTLASRYIASRTAGQKRRKVVEDTIPVGSQVYVLGTAQLPHESLQPYIGPDRVGRDLFLVRVGSEDDALYRERVGVGLGAFLALVGGAAAPTLWHHSYEIAAAWATEPAASTTAAAPGAAIDTFGWGDIEPMWPLLGVAGVLLAMSLLSLVFTYNGLVRLRQRAQAAWSLIDVQLRRRHDLVPNLAAAVSAHAAHEAEVQRSITELRTSLLTQLPANPSDDAVRDADRAIRAEDAALGRLLALVEDYPTLTADASFSALRAELVDTEDRIALARSFYNASVQVLHDRAKAVPGNLVAWVFELDLDAEFTDVADPRPQAATPPDVRSAALTFPTGASPATLARRLRT